MRYGILLALTFFLIGSQTWAAEFKLLPAFFATYGDYSNGRASQDGAGYATLAVNGQHYATLAYDDLRLSHAAWTYRQKMVAVSGLIAWHSWSWNVFAASLEGRFNSRNFDDTYSDHARLIGGEWLRMGRKFSWGAEYVYFEQNGFPDLHSSQWTLRGGIALNTRMHLSVRPNYVHVSDRRDLFSVSAKCGVQLTPRITTTIAFARGERAFYFDNDLLTIYNQPETQLSAAIFRVDWEWIRAWWLTLEGIHTEFRDYSVDYWVAGLKTRLSL